MTHQEFQTNRRQYMVKAGLLLGALALLSTSLESMENSSQGSANAIAAHENVRKPLTTLLQNAARKVGYTIDASTLAIYSTPNSFEVVAIVLHSGNGHDTNASAFAFYDTPYIKKGLYAIEAEGDTVSFQVDGIEKYKFDLLHDSPTNGPIATGYTICDTAAPTNGGPPVAFRCVADKEGFVDFCYDANAPLPPG